MAFQEIDPTGNESMDLTLGKIRTMLAELYADDTAVAAATVSGSVTSSALTTAAGATASITITNAKIKATSKVFVSVKNGTNTAGIPVLVSVTPGSGSAVAVVANLHATDAFNGTLKLDYMVAV